MSKIEELIKQYCPDGVSLVELNKVCEFQNGFVFKSSLFRESGLPVLRITNIKDCKINDEGYIYFNLEDYKENLTQYQVHKGDVVVAMSGATTGKIGYNYSDTVYYLNQRVGMFVPNENKLNKRYLFHWLCSQSDNILHISSGSGAQPNLSSVKMMEFKIPIPPMVVQEEIVKILDNFSELTTELTTELTARKQQYDFYRDKLLTFSNDTKSYLIKDIVDIHRGVRLVKSELVENGKYPVFQNSLAPMGYYDKYNQESNKTYIISAGAAGEIGFCDKKFWAADDCLVLTANDTVKDKFIYHYLMTKKDFINSRVRKASIPRLSREVIENLEIRVPSIDVQERIVNVLDNFDKICSDLGIGLPAEIEARQKQYEYYREKLLTFDNKVETLLTEPNRTEPNRTEPNRTEPNRTN